MKLENLLWASVAAYYAVLAVIYRAVGGEAAGTALLVLACAFGGLIAGWLWSWRRHHPAPLGQDLGDADIADEAEVIGVYPTASLRPLGIAAGMTAIAAGVPLGLWLTLVGLSVLAAQVALLVRDSDR